jgi:hypothetical protein
MLMFFTIIKAQATIKTPLPSPTLNNNSLVNSGPQDVAYIGFFFLLISLVVIVGFLNKKLEYALIFAFILSLILIAFLWFL